MTEPHKIYELREYVAQGRGLSRREQELLDAWDRLAASSPPLGPVARDEQRLLLDIAADYEQTMEYMTMTDETRAKYQDRVDRLRALASGARQTSNGSEFTDAQRLDYMERCGSGCAIRHPDGWRVTDIEKRQPNHKGRTLREAVDAAIRALAAAQGSGDANG